MIFVITFYYPITLNITALQAGKLRVRFPIISLEFSITAHAMTLGPTQLLTEKITRNISWEVGIKGVGA
jgi:hypothetical protein